MPALASLYWARDLVPFGVSVPDEFSKSLTIAGLLNHGRKRYPLEWSLVCPRLLVSYLASDRPHDFDEVDMLNGIRDFVADRAHARPR